MNSLLRAAGMRGLKELLATHQLALEPLLDATAIPRLALSDEDLRISLVAYAQLMETAAELSQQPDLGLQMADHQNIGILGPLAIAMQNAATLREAMDVCAAHLHTHSPGIRLSMHHDTPAAGQIGLRIRLITPSWMPNRQVMDQCMGDLHHFIMWLVGRDLPIDACELPHEPLAPVSRYESAFTGPVTFGAREAQLILPNEFLDLSLAGASAQLHRLSLDYLQMAYEPGRSSLREQVEAILRRALSSTRGRREVVAQLLELHPRTLQRRLADEGCCFQDLVDDIRRERAIHWLTTTDMPLSQIPGQLGLADQTVLNRNCQRWFAQSPGAVRRGQLRH